MSRYNAWLLSKLHAVNGFLLAKYFHRTPFYATYNVTFRCNSRCVYCDYWKQDWPELRTEDALRVVDRIAESGVSMLAISGGEPLLRKDIAEILKEARNVGTLNTLNTSGLIRNEPLAKEISRLIDALTISIDGPPEIHDQQRGIRGAYERSLGTLKMYKSLGIYTGVNLVLTELNKDHLWEVFEMIDDYIDFMTVQPVNPPSGRITEDNLKALERIRSTGKLLLPETYIKRMKDYYEGKFSKICEALGLYFAVDPMGNLMPCAPRHDIKLGNLLESSYMELVRNASPASIKKINDCTGCYLVCTVGISDQINYPIIKSAYENIRAYL